MAQATATAADVVAGERSTVRNRTNNETALLAAFEDAGGQLPGGGWVAQLRNDALAAFAEAGLPSRKLESWRYTDLRERLKQVYPPARGVQAVTADRALLDEVLGPLADLEANRLVLVNGRYAPEMSDTDGLGDIVEQMPLAPLLAKAPTWMQDKFKAGRLVIEDAVTALNGAFMSDGMMVKIKPGQSTQRPLMIVHARAGGTSETITTRNIFAIEAGAVATIIEVFVALPGSAAAATTNTLCDIAIADGARLEHIACAMETREAEVISTCSARVGASASYRSFNLLLGSRLVRRGMGVALEGENSNLDISGTFIGAGTDHIDSTLLIEHIAPGCESRELFKGILADRARGVFQGKVIVRKDAQKTDGKQMAQALMLSENAEFDSKPELEIYADDVACGHGATCAQLDPEHVFYCMSRGIPESEARALLIHAFAADALDKIEDAAIGEGLRIILEARLAQQISSGQTA